MAAARGLPIPAADEIPPELEYSIPSKPTEERIRSEKNIHNLMVPISSRSQSYNSDTSSGTHPTTPALPSPLPPSPTGASSSNSHLFRGRAKTLASLTTSSKAAVQTDMYPRELQLPHDPFVNGQPIEAYLYKDASECPICFLYYPPYLNKTRCCDQPICSECFVQIKRPDPHPPEHEQSDPNAPAPSENEPARPTDGQLVSEPAACPFCVQPEFGVTYMPPPFRRGLAYVPTHGIHPLANAASPASSTSSVASGNANPHLASARRRAASLSANSPNVITTDKIRPDWAQKLATARAHAARRSAAATALHTAAYLMNAPGNTSESRNFSGLGRRNVLRRASSHGVDSPTGGISSPHLNALALLAERRTNLERENDSAEESSTNLVPPRASSRRSRIDELEDLMVMEAIRLSLISEEERRKKEEKGAKKDAKKEAKRKEKETKKAEKHARKNGLYSNNPSNAALDSPGSAMFGRVDSGASSIVGEEASSTNKGKSVQRTTSPLTVAGSGIEDFTSSGKTPKLGLKKPDDSQPSSSVLIPSPVEPHKRSHLRHISSTSSSVSSLVESACGERIGSGTTSSGGVGSLESMLNFRNLAAVIGDEGEGCTPTQHVGSAESQNAGDVATTASTKTDPKLSSDGTTLATQERPRDMHQNGEDALDGKELQPQTVELTAGTTEAEN